MKPFAPGSIVLLELNFRRESVFALVPGLLFLNSFAFIINTDFKFSDPNSTG